jgi:hypothetical protein
MKISDKHNQTILKDKEIDEEVEISKCTNCTIENVKFSQRVEVSACEVLKIMKCDFTYNKNDTTMLTLKNCVKSEVTKCDFHDKDTYGLLIKLIGEDTKDNVIQGCKFYKFKYDGNENAEPIRIGDSRLSGCIFNTTVRYCHFDNLQADVETVSIKSCGNTLEYNKHENCRSSFVIRHGGLNKIRNNLFIGSGGIRVYGDNNEITGNYHQNNSNESKPPLIIANGTLEDDPNFESEGKPKGNEGCGHAVYARTKNNIIRDNIYENCEGVCVNWGWKKYELDEEDRKEKDCNGKKYKLKEKISPTKNTFENNIIVSDDNGNEESSLVVFKEAEPNSNTFGGNQLYGKKSKKGDLPEDAITELSKKPEIKIPNVGPDAL